MIQKTILSRYANGLTTLRLPIDLTGQSWCRDSLHHDTLQHNGPQWNEAANGPAANTARPDVQPDDAELIDLERLYQYALHLARSREGAERGTGPWTSRASCEQLRNPSIGSVRAIMCHGDMNKWGPARGRRPFGAGHEP